MALSFNATMFDSIFEELEHVVSHLGWQLLLKIINMATMTQLFKIESLSFESIFNMMNIMLAILDVGRYQKSQK